MSSEAAVVASNICAIPEAITHGQDGMLFSAGNIDELAKVTTMLLQDEKFRKRLGTSARQKMIREFSWDTIADKTVDVYKELLAA
jgi:glycosyltransferase involved in cell wall biosynthesis